MSQRVRPVVLRWVHRNGDDIVQTFQRVLTSIRNCAQQHALRVLDDAIRAQQLRSDTIGQLPLTALKWAACVVD